MCQQVLSCLPIYGSDCGWERALKMYVIQNIFLVVIGVLPTQLSYEYGALTGQIFIIVIHFLKYEINEIQIIKCAHFSNLGTDVSYGDEHYYFVQ